MSLDLFIRTKILDYIPDEDELKVKFRYWHVESLLNQAADIIDKSLQELKEYQSLAFAWKQLELELAADESILKLDESRANEKEYFHRPCYYPAHEENFLSHSKGALQSSLEEAETLYNYQATHGQSEADWTRAGQNLNEKRIEIHAREFQNFMNSKQLVWTQWDEAYNREVLNLRRVTFESKKRQTLTQESPFSLNYQAELILERLNRNYRDALNRAKVAEEGLKKIYGYDIELLLDQRPDLATCVSQLANWVRDSIEFLMAYSQLDQSFTRIVSVRSIVGESKWQEISSSSSNEFEMLMSIPSSIFSSHENIRLRGLSSSMIGNAGVIPWTIILQVPKNAVYLRNGVEVIVLQDKLPPCLLGRVENRTSNRPVELAGLVSLMNASPIQSSNTSIPEKEKNWGIKIICPTNSQENFANLDDIIVEINAVGRPKI